jgi:hypothetical protein
MQRKPRSDLPEVAPNVPFVVLASLFGFPGAGHIMVGRKRLGIACLAAFAIAFIGLIYEFAILVPQMMSLDKLMEGHLSLPPWQHPVLVKVWGGLAATIWAASAIHAGILASQRSR